MRSREDQADFGEMDRSDGRKAGLAAAGGLLGALAAASCCILPLVFFALGVSGAWIATLTALTPYQPFFVAVTLALLAVGHYLVYRRPRAACADAAACAGRLPRRGVRLALWVATVLIGLVLSFPFAARLLLRS